MLDQQHQGPFQALDDSACVLVFQLDCFQCLSSYSVSWMTVSSSILGSGADGTGSDGTGVLRGATSDCTEIARGAISVGIKGGHP